MRNYNTLKSWSQYKTKDFEDLEKEHNVKVIGKAVIGLMTVYGLLVIGLIF